MKKYFISMLLTLIATSAYAFEVSGEHFDAKFKIDSITVGENESTINASSPEVGQYGKVYVSYHLTSNPGIEGSGTWTGYGRGISADGVLARGILRGVAIIRELFGSGTLMGYEILPLVSNGGWYVGNNLLLLPPSSFIIIGLFIWAIRSIRPEQVEDPDFKLAKHSTAPDLSKRELNV